MLYNTLIGSTGLVKKNKKKIYFLFFKVLCEKPVDVHYTYYALTVIIEKFGTVYMQFHIVHFSHSSHLCWVG